MRITPQAVWGHKLSDDFAQTNAYSELFVELLSGDKAAVEFINGIIPQRLAAEIAKNPQLLEPLA
jgi:hypothetical protein